jgi:hypothetical protein
VTYFGVTRSVLVDQAHTPHEDATADYREAKTYAKWSAKKREAKLASLPPLIDEQAKQRKTYLRMIEEHHALNPDSEREE